MSDQLSALKEFARSTWAKVLIVLTVISVLLGIATEAVVLYGQSLEAVIKTETASVAYPRQGAEAEIAELKEQIEREAANNAAMLEQARAAKAQADAEVAAAVAANAPQRQASESQFEQQKAIVQQSLARYAERMKSAEAIKLKAEAEYAQEIARNSEVKERADAQRIDIESKVAEAIALANQWLNNCMRTGRIQASCSMAWGLRN